MLDRSKFSQTLKLIALRVPVALCGQYMKDFKPCLFKRPRVKSIVDEISNESEVSGSEGGDEKDEKREKRQKTNKSNSERENKREKAQWKVLLLDQQVTDTKLTGLSEKLRAVAESGKEKGVTPIEYNLTLDYSHMSADVVLRSYLPSEVTVPSSFETIGHIAHLNLREEHEPYKKVIGQVVLDKNPVLRTVITKVGTIENEFRVFDMEVLAGETNFVTEVKEHNCTFKLDYSQVYWNSRLSSEHTRIVDLLTDQDLLCDVCAGIGPFAIPAGKKGCRVLANDLNPVSCKYLAENAKINRVDADKVVGFNMDGRLFIKQVWSEVERHRGGNVHFTMNLPALAIEFLDAFRDVDYSRKEEEKEKEKEEKKIVYVHVYGFSSAPSTELRQVDVIQRITTALGVPPNSCNVRDVRHVSPTKEYICASFILPIGALLEQQLKQMK